MQTTIIISNPSQPKWTKEVTIFTDGASRGNPGPAAFGLTALNPKQQTIFEEACLLDSTTNNVAEYLGVRRALELAVQNKIQKLILKTDSQLVVEQLTGHYKIKSKNLKPIFQECIQLIQKIPHFQCLHVMREDNQRADELANLALDTEI